MAYNQVWKQPILRNAKAWDSPCLAQPLAEWRRSNAQGLEGFFTTAAGHLPNTTMTQELPQSKYPQHCFSCHHLLNILCHGAHSSVVLATHESPPTWNFCIYTHSWNRINMDMSRKISIFMLLAAHTWSNYWWEWDSFPQHYRLIVLNHTYQGVICLTWCKVI